jgi:hypothetical protein
MGTARLTGSGYCEVGHSDSIDVLRDALSAAIVEHGVGDLDAGTLKLTAPRAFTQAVSRYVFEQTTDNGEPVFAGIAYRSKLGDELMNWAVFEDNDPYVLAVEVVEVDDEDLATVMEAFNLKFAER